jgi:hypothetical protein
MAISMSNIFKILYATISEFQDNDIALRDFKSTWITKNPGQQLLSGSFDPTETSWEDWIMDAYDPTLEEIQNMRWR